MSDIVECFRINAEYHKLSRDRKLEGLSVLKQWIQSEEIKLLNDKDEIFYQREELDDGVVVFKLK